MSKTRLEAFSDCVLSIIITVMVLNLRVPRGADLASLAPDAPLFLCYLVSFVFVGTYWNNHHHLLQAVRRISGAVLWANLHLLFWLSLLPFVTAWLGTNNFAPLPTALYDFDLLMCGVAYSILSHSLIAAEGKDSPLAKAVGSAAREKISLVGYASAIPIAFWNRWVSLALIMLVGMLWLIPDRRIESMYDSDAN